ncbi:MAG: hypothetical protein M3R21_07955 [Candidatus Dormibacteraeota bacterium]|nr:hypothetical protein [Candidatus Dormibacteraeota bacterium]
MSDPRGDFADRIMGAVGNLPTPSATKSLMAAVRARSLGDAVSAFRVAWHLGTVRRWSVGRRVRVRAIALVLGVLVALGVGSIATATAVRLAATGVNELGNVINRQFGTDQPGQVQNDTPDTEGAEQLQDGGAQDTKPGNAQEGTRDTSGADDAGGIQEGDDASSPPDDASHDANGPGGASNGDAGNAGDAENAAGGEGNPAP